MSKGKAKAQETAGIEAFIGGLAGKTEKIASLDEIKVAGPIELAGDCASQSRLAADADRADPDLARFIDAAAADLAEQRDGECGAAATTAT